jgi:hypothetical protein
MQLYVIREGQDGPVVAGTHRYSYETAVHIRDTLTRPFRMWIRREHYWVIPEEHQV